MPVAAAPELDHEGIRELAEILDIRQPILVRWAPPEDTNTLGVHRWVAGEHEITIYLHGDRTRLDFQRTLIHEMVHSSDAEAHGSCWLETYWANQEAFERRANQMALRLAHHVRVVSRIGP